eukprot:3016579-Pleurochrysis_carterae.AAC.1
MGNVESKRRQESRNRVWYQTLYESGKQWVGPYERVGTSLGKQGAEQVEAGQRQRERVERSGAQNGKDEERERNWKRGG